MNLRKPHSMRIFPTVKIHRKSKDLIEFIFLMGIDSLTSTTSLHKLLRSYGGWETESSYWRQLQSLREKDLVEYDNSRPKCDWIPQLTQSAQNVIPQSLDPESAWNRQWDKQWRSITFDIPANEKSERKRLDRWLDENRFGHLQGSLWVSPRSYTDWTTDLSNLNIDPKSVIFMEGRPLGQLDDQAIVTRSWPFEKLALLHDEYLRLLEKQTPQSIDQLCTSFRQEAHMWRACCDKDPFLPNELHPPNYKGTLCWEHRKAAYKHWSSLL
ncbi:hypothetical protein [Pelagicoccus mobilis]|uniref:Transcriptional repressor PaaX-like central Cas2-like domain-containing protein n=1 Tax=Pelagicoccus mobilis TaxID=415221 RepID=A0A934RYA2_9BACT|nr:hypothetical protein [Pelagicoccus mobilis]MBK1879955.1 hypothetical protein [Pelagicoccus mobilis]